ncbi:UDP-3-O-(3-hydroxymyristoyl)glucosamine N-acyltransferase [Tuwongella immobilis]|nr:UDP-3-O-(3-hydroxymyristoyl)glucosamine N-acyltransferase [Tuwongella immobilis]
MDERTLTVPVTVRQLAEWVHGEVVGDADRVIVAARTPREAQPGDIVFLDHLRHRAMLAQSQASAYVASEDAGLAEKTLIRVKDPFGAFLILFQRLNQIQIPELIPGIDPTARIDSTASVDPTARIDAFAVIGANTIIGPRCWVRSGVAIGARCRLGAEVQLHPHVVLYDDCSLGDRVIIHANAVLGADGYGYRFQGGRHVKIPQMGGVVIENDVEIGAGSTVDRGTFGPTRIGEGSKLDNLVMVGHNTQIGRHVLLCAQVGIAGSCTVGDYVVMGGQVGVGDHLEIGDGAQLAGQSGIKGDIEPRQRIFGTPGVPIREWSRLAMAMKKVPELLELVEKLRDQLDAYAELPPERADEGRPPLREAS